MGNPSSGQQFRPALSNGHKMCTTYGMLSFLAAAFKKLKSDLNKCVYLTQYTPNIIISA